LIGLNKVCNKAKIQCNAIAEKKKLLRILNKQDFSLDKASVLTAADQKNPVDNPSEESI